MAAPVECVLLDLYGTLVDIRLDEDALDLWTGMARALAGSRQAPEPVQVRRVFQSILKEESERAMRVSSWSPRSVVWSPLSEPLTMSRAWGDYSADSG